MAWLAFMLLLAGCVYQQPSLAPVKDFSDGPIELDASSWFALASKADEGSEKRAKLTIPEHALSSDQALWMEAALDVPDRSSDVASWGIVAYRNVSDQPVPIGIAFSTDVFRGPSFERTDLTLTPARFILGRGFHVGETVDLAFTASWRTPTGGGSSTLRPIPVTFLWRIVPSSDATPVPNDVAEFRQARASGMTVLTDEKEYAHKLGFSVSAALLLARGGNAMDVLTRDVGLAGDPTIAPAPISRDYTTLAQTPQWNTMVAFTGGASAGVTYSFSGWAGGQKSITNAKALPATGSSGPSWDLPVVITESGRVESNAVIEEWKVTWTGAPSDRAAGIFAFHTYDSTPRPKDPAAERAMESRISCIRNDAVVELDSGQTWTWVGACASTFAAAQPAPAETAFPVAATAKSTSASLTTSGGK